jgi:hypothetical protein
MSKVKQETRGHYELLYIIPNKFTEEEAGQIHEKIKENLNQHVTHILLLPTFIFLLDSRWPFNHSSRTNAKDM